MFQFLHKTKRLLVCFIFSLFWTIPPLGASEEGTVLLSFDVEKFLDFDYLSQMNIDIPATYFITGELAEMVPEGIGGLVNPYNTIGSHSFLHTDLSQLDEEGIRVQLQTSKALLESLAGGQPILWYRAPFMEEDQRVINVAIQLGYKFTSSSFEMEEEKEGLPSIPVSMGSWYLEAADYVWFIEFNLDNQMVLNYLVDSFERAKVKERPLVVLLHPSIIFEHKEVLSDFIQYVKKNNGVFLSFDGYMQAGH